MDRDGFKIEPHVGAERDPTHLHVVRVLSRQVKDLALLQFETCERSSECYAGRDVQQNVGLASAGRRCQAVDVAPLEHTLQQVIGRFETGCELASAADKWAILYTT